MTVPPELELILEGFERNARVTRALLATLDMDVLGYDDGVGGFSVGQHLADIVSFRRDWLSRVSPQHAEAIPDATATDSPTWLGVASIAELQAAFDAGDAAMRDAVLDAVSDGRQFQGAYESHPAHILVHCIVHDSHHRGQIAALLRQSGRSAEEREALEDASWPIWRR
ncbi:MAG: DinB family protein [Trueperaceae bacterium]|nr:DinB family protein [Trueperaceae bacterium]